MPAYKKAERFFWFGPESLSEWTEYLRNGADRAEFHVHGDEALVSFFEGDRHMGTVNVSHVCPIDCP